MSTELVLAPPTPGRPALDELRRAVLHGVAAENSRRNYALALEELSAFCELRQEPISRILILQFRAAMLDRNLRGKSTREIHPCERLYFRIADHPPAMPTLAIRAQ